MIPGVAGKDIEFNATSRQFYVLAEAPAGGRLLETYDNQFNLVSSFPLTFSSGGAFGAASFALDSGTGNLYATEGGVNGGTATSSYLVDPATGLASLYETVADRSHQSLFVFGNEIYYNDENYIFSDAIRQGAGDPPPLHRIGVGNIAEGADPEETYPALTSDVIGSALVGPDGFLWVSANYQGDNYLIKYDYTGNEFSTFQFIIDDHVTNHGRLEIYDTSYNHTILPLGPGMPDGFTIADSASVPEPSSVWFFGAGCACAFLRRRRG
ncbi:PEP-CTERM sorting domain-containing protein [Roseibacillus ishigakijimensis]|uniref:PEP-CTERM sorting domain-containing protein n=1 Tax=Roseibacillus ishigakijimensis TaxID=454146 RepID=A0A934VLM7_9BACT|nr:PEP-CTERM sorting domain-containing protein [Roseibacillus ishigakijimensis]MBK1833266.1 PEP-CTERM sorting domain-containing protein [Roseibacillus ishigakijimensis]